MTMYFSLKMSVDEANHIKHLLETNLKQQEAWIIASQSTDEERADAKKNLEMSKTLLRQF